MATQSHDEVVKKILDDLRDLRERLADTFDRRTDDTERKKLIKTSGITGTDLIDV